MHIHSFTATQALSLLTRSQPPATNPSATTTPFPSPVAVPTSAPAVAKPAKAPATGSHSSSKTSSGGAHGSSNSSTDSDEAATIAAVYSTTIAGKTYSGSVESADGQYTVSIPNLPGATASGSSIQSAEDNLGSIIDVIA